MLAEVTPRRAWGTAIVVTYVALLVWLGDAGGYAMSGFVAGMGVVLLYLNIVLTRPMPSYEDYVR